MKVEKERQLAAGASRTYTIVRHMRCSTNRVVEAALSPSTQFYTRIVREIWPYSVNAPHR